MIRALVFLGLICVPAVAWGQQYVISTLAGGNPPVTPAKATATSIGDPPRVAVDAAGNIYFPSIHSVFKVDTAGTLTRIAGTGRSGMSGDGGPALNAQLTYPVGIAVDSAGNVYVTDRDQDVIRKISPNGTISRFAGTGKTGYGGDGGPALDALFNGPTGLNFDSAGNLYVADTNNSCIRKISTDGTIIRVAGTLAREYGGDNGPALQADLNDPEGMAVDSAGNLYIADTFNNRIRRVSPDGIMTTFAGDGFPGGSGDNGPAGVATLFLPTDVTVDRSGTIYIADLGPSRIRTVSQGIIRSAAGFTTGPGPSDGDIALSVRLSGPTGVAVDAAGNFYFAEGSIGSGSGLTGGDFRIWKVDQSGIITSVAGNGLRSFSGDDGPAARAQIDTPGGMATDAAGNVYFADTVNNRVRKITPGGTITTIAGFGEAGFAGDGGPAASALLNSPMGVAVDASGHVYIADTANNRIREILTNGTIGTVAGNGNAAFFGDGTSALNAALHAPRAVAISPAGDIYIADTEDHRVRRIDGNGILDTFVGRGQGLGGDGGPATQALLNLPSALAFDKDGNLYIADQGNNRIRKVSAATGNISTLAGTDTVFPGDDGPATNAAVLSPQGVFVDPAGNVFLTDSGENRIRKVAPNGTITTVAGTGDCCYANDGGPATNASLNAPWGLTGDAAGNLYVADSKNNAIRLLQAVSSGSAQGVTVANGASAVAGPVAPGEIVSLYGVGLGPVQGVQYQVGPTGVVTTQLAGVSVTFNGIFAPILYASSRQVTAVVPYGVSGQTAQVVAQYQSLITLSTSVPIAASSPAIFTTDATGTGQAAAVNQDGQANSAGHPAAAGSTITLIATGEGQTSPAGIDGQINSAPLPRPVLSVAVTIGGQTAAVQSASGQAGSVAGILVVTVQIPSGTAPGNAVPVIMQVGGASSPTGVTIAVSAP